MNETTTFRRLAATLTIGSFAIAALMGIAALLSPGSFGPTEWRVLATTSIVGAASILTLCYLTAAGRAWAPVGATGGLVMLLPLTTSLIQVWSDGFTGEAVWKSFGVGLVFAVALAHICLLLALAGNRPRLGPVLWHTVALAAVVAGWLSLLIVGAEPGDGDLRLLGVLAILDVLGTLVTVALGAFGRRDRSGPQTALSFGS